MNPVTDAVFIITWILLLVWAIRSIISGVRSRSVRDFNAGRLQGEWTTEVKKPVHPEMKDVQPGEQLMGVTFLNKKECDLEEYKALQARIEEIRQKLEDDDDGDIVVRA